MKKICPLLTAKGIQVTDLTKPGWTHTEANITTLHCKSGSFEKYLNQLYSTDQIAMVWFCENHH
jgi:hypothetical protein